ncbi:hypothetical protein AURANDRAFT_67755 [Aureococcus anophagefferens]|uniref:Uncharacterized protein n=1 Tax=Aureococcus anophagefferens TaxID=44056 RepID=F0YMA5_AURAN|nr:hypothetical protein AURANDRAFT_67755 [Aureococcus anophagefferens]EGB03765.1 hypothetical protein AURANDRAFT_67755 [Aureococcus anophagefferens]|eukprot:XP_009041550.1 hypothetical protein AURANDRAFT_67755 [Aureococcus anophagefferens]
MARRLVAAALLLLIPTRGDDGGRCHIEVVVDGAARRLETSVPPPERPELVAGARDFAEDLGLATGAGCDTVGCVAERLADMLGARCAADEYRRRSRREPRCRELGRATACAELAPPLLQTTEAAAGAHCVVGLARTFPRVAASIADAVAPLGAADFFFVFGGAQASAAPDAAWRGAFDRFPQIAQFVVDDTGGQLQKLQLCFGHVLAAEAAAGRQYAWVAKHRPDLRWTAPLPAALARTRDVVHCYNLAGVCPRASVGEGWPCDVPNAANATFVNGVAAVPVCAPVFQVAMARSLPAQDRAERHLYKGLDLARDLARAAEPFSDAFAECALDFLAWTCRAYDAYLEAWARDAAPRDAAGRLLVDAAPATPAWDDGSAAHALYAAVAARDGAGAAHALARLGDAYAAALRYATLGVDGQGPGSAAFGPWSSHDDKRPPRVPFLDAQCGPRAACRRPGGGPGAAYAAELCARSFAPDVLASPFYFRAAPLMEGVAGCSARHLLARAAVTWGGGVEWIEARAGRAV